ncbi:MAG: hypothetical protein IJP18_05150 [Oscillospiraceae bacterium]|nr:hypothetical protein [Oscillospiraceae bacterium]MBQ9981937.1 hypothetical protein [Oscillospiraceae bacterium]
METKDIVLVAGGILLIAISAFSKRNKKEELKKMVGLFFVTALVLVAVVVAGYFL